MTERIYSEQFVIDAGSIDMLGHVNNREYVRWMEHIATAHAASLGWTYERLQSIGRIWVVREHWVEYLRPAFLGESLEILTWVQGWHGPACMRRYAVKRGADLIMVGATEWIFVDFERKRPALLMPEIYNSFPVVPSNDPELAVLGIARPVRYAPPASLC